MPNFDFLILEKSIKRYLDDQNISSSSSSFTKFMKNLEIIAEDSEINFESANINSNCIEDKNNIFKSEILVKNDSSESEVNLENLNFESN